MPVATPRVRFETLADLLQALGSIPPDRVLVHPRPGTATYRDLVEIERAEAYIYEIICGTAVARPVGFAEACVAAHVAAAVGEYANATRSGIVVGPKGRVQLAPDTVRSSDVAYFDWSRFPGR
jgi:hypothetical protein